MLQAFNQYKVVDIDLSAPQCDWLPASRFTTMHLQQIQEIWKSEYLLGDTVKSTLHSICRLSSYPWVRKQGADTFPTLLWETGVVVVLITNSTMSTQPPYGVVYRGQTGHFDSQGIHMTQLALLQPRGNYGSLRHRGEGSCKLKQRVSHIKPENKS